MTQSSFIRRDTEIHSKKN